MSESLATIGRRLERGLTGRLPEDVRRNLRVEAVASLAYGVFYAGSVTFLPVVLRRLGAPSELLALYIAQTYLGSVLASFSVALMRGRHPKTFAVTCWLLARSLFLPAVLVVQAGWLLALTAVFWLLEAFPAPAYARIVQTIYPKRYRGRSLSIVRVAMVLALLIATPVAGWSLDRFGHQFTLPIAGAIGVVATLIFSRLRVEDGDTALVAERPRTSIWSIPGRDRRFTIYLLAFSLYGLGFLMGFPLYTIVQVDRLQLSYTTIGYLGLAQSLFWLLGNLYWGPLLDKRGGLWVLRANVGIALLVPLSYMWAPNAWFLLPAFVAHGIISAGVDLGVISTGIELAGPDSVAEYTALQATVIGARGMVGPFVGTALVAAGLADRAVFAIGAGLIVGAWLLLGTVVVERRRAPALEEPGAEVTR